MVKRPPGNKINPDCSDEKPKSVWQKLGNTKFDPYKPKPRINDVIMPAEKLLLCMIIKLTIG